MARDPAGLIADPTRSREVLGLTLQNSWRLEHIVESAFGAGARSGEPRLLGKVPATTLQARAGGQAVPRPLVSVITPCLNAVSHIRPCIESVTSQIDAHFEHIVVDGGSIDGTLRVVERLPGAAGRIVISEPDRGAADAINKGLLRAAGQIVCWLNANDKFASPFTLSRVSAIFATQPEVGFLMGDGYLFDDSGFVRPIFLGDPAYLTPSCYLRRDILFQPACFWRRNELLLNPDYKYAFDWDFFIRLCFRLGGIYYLREPLALYRLHDDSLTLSDTAARKLEIYKVCKEYTGFRAATLWNYMIYAAYRFSEVIHIKHIKKMIWYVDAAVARLSRGRLGSC
jgi:glycosyltransferase involved in cell wall biosynthesis